MWYFAWILGLPLAAMFAVVNAMWVELQEDRRAINDQGRNDQGRNDQDRNEQGGSARR